MKADAAQFAMLRLASPALPIGGFSYSQGLEAAIEAGWVMDTRTLTDWIQACLDANIGRFEAPLTWSISHAQRRGAERERNRLNELFLASRETRELYAETTQMGYSLLRLLANRTVDGLPSAQSDTAAQWLEQSRPCSLPLAWALAADALELSPVQSLNAYLWAWAENQVSAGIKAIPLGQQAGQQVLDAVAPGLTDAVSAAPRLQESAWSNFAPRLAIASCQHETQYSRLFRS